MKKAICLTLFVLILFSSYSQMNKDWYDIYSNQNIYWSASKIADVVDRIKFKPKRGNPLIFKQVTLMLGKEDIDQINKDALYLCAVKHYDYLKLWNMIYPIKLSQESWDEYCPIFLCLMCIDGTAKVR